MRASIWVVLVVGIPALVFAQEPSPIGVEFQVNSYTNWWQEYPAVAFGPQGEFVVVWQDGTNTVAGEDGDRTGIKGQRYDSDGNRVGTEFQVNTHTTDIQTHPGVAVGPGSDFFVVWAGVGPDDPRGVWGRRYDSSGVPIGGVFRINSNTISYQGHPDIEAGPGGEFVVVWQSIAQAGPDTEGSSVAAQLFDANGTPNGTEFQVNTVTTLNQGTGEVAKAPDGTFVVVYSSTGSMGGDIYPNSIQVSRFNADGSRIGSELQVNTYITSNQRRPQINVGPDGKFVVVWESDGAPAGQDQQFYSVRGQRFSAGGIPIGGEFQVNTTEVGTQYYPDVSVGAGGNFVVVWNGYGPGPDPDGAVVAQAFDNRGVPVGGEFQVNTITTYKEDQPRIAIDPAGTFVVAWRGYGSFGDDDSRYSIQARRYSFPPDLVFADSFGSGDTSEWSSSVP